MDALQFFSPFLAAGLGAGISAWVATRIATNNFANALNVQSDKHRKDLEREAINARRIREEKRVHQLVDEYSKYFALAIDYVIEMKEHTREGGKSVIYTQSQFLQMMHVKQEERHTLGKKLMFLDLNERRRELVKQCHTTVPGGGIPPLAAFDRLLDNLSTIQEEIRVSLHGELRKLD